MEQPSLDGSDIAAAIRFANFLLGHELAHLVAGLDQQPVDATFYRFEEHYPRLIRPSATLAEELFCDQQALVILSENDVYGSAMRFNDEFSLAMAIERLQHEVRLAAPRVSSLLTARLAPDRAPTFNPKREKQMQKDWGYRMFQVDVVLDELLDRAGLSEGEREQARAVRQSLEEWTAEIIAEDIVGALS